MDHRRTRSSSKRIIPIHVTIFLFVFLVIINPEMISTTPSIAVWTFESINISEADTREYVDSLIYHLERKNVFRIVDVGNSVLDFVPELSLTGALRRENESFDVSIRLDNNRSGETIKNFTRGYSAMGELFEDSNRFVDEIVFQYNVSEQFLFREDILSLHKYVFQGTVYENRFSDYMDLVESIESQPEISEELKKAIKTYRCKGLRHGVGKMFEWIGKTSAGIGLCGFALLGERAGNADGEWENSGEVLLVLGGLIIGGGGVYLVGITLSDPKPDKVVEIYNRDADE